MRLTGLVGLVTASTLGLAACSSNATTTTTTNASATTAAPAASTGLCAGVKLVFFPGGTAGGGFETVV